MFELPPMKNATKRLQQQIEFILEIDKLKQVMRRTQLLDKSRTENDAEHSWHLAMLAMVLAEYADPEVNINRVISMLLIHDLVEIDAGDTFLYDESFTASLKAERELNAAERIYNLLPEDIKLKLMNLWKEFEERKTADAKFAAGLDRLQPLLHNYFTGGGAWAVHNVTAEKVMSKKHLIQEASEVLGKLAEDYISDAVNRGDLKSGKT